MQEQLNAAVIDEERAIALMAALKTGKAPVLGAALLADPVPQPAGSPSAATQLHAEWLDIAARLGRLRAEQLRREAEIATVQQLIAKLEATLPIAQHFGGTPGRRRGAPTT